MRLAPYIRAEQAISAADQGGIRERWMWGLRVLHDPEAMSSPASLRHGVTDKLIRAAKARGLKLNEREIRYRMTCARTYPTEAQIRHAGAAFGTWTDLRNAGFPPIERPEGEPDADWRTKPERRAAHGRTLIALCDQQGSLFPDEWDEATTTLREAVEYAEEQAKLTGNFVARDKRRAAHLAVLIEAAGGDLAVTMAAAAAAANEVEGLTG